MDGLGYSLTWPLRKALDVAYGIHSGCPLCCVLAFVTGRATELHLETRHDYGYRLCRRCAAEIDIGVRKPVVVESCDRRALTCRVLASLSRIIGWAYRDLCPLCNQRGLQPVPVWEEDGDGGIQPSTMFDFAHCTYCNELVATNRG